MKKLIVFMSGLLMIFVLAGVFCVNGPEDPLTEVTNYGGYITLWK